MTIKEYFCENQSKFDLGFSLIIGVYSLALIMAIVVIVLQMMSARSNKTKARSVIKIVLKQQQSMERKLNRILTYVAYGLKTGITKLPPVDIDKNAKNEQTIFERRLFLHDPKFDDKKDLFYKQTCQFFGEEMSKENRERFMIGIRESLTIDERMKRLLNRSPEKQKRKVVADLRPKKSDSPPSSKKSSREQTASIANSLSNKKSGAIKISLPKTERATVTVVASLDDTNTTKS